MPKFNVKISTTDPEGPDGITQIFPDAQNDVEGASVDWHMAGVLVMGQEIIEGVAEGLLKPFDKIWAVVDDGSRQHVIAGCVPPESEMEGLRETYDEAEDTAFEALMNGEPIMTWPRRDRGRCS